MGETKFGPNDAITREELVTLLYRYAQYFGHSCIGTSIEGFADAGLDRALDSLKSGK